MESLTPEYDILWPALTSGTLIRRYKRFLADVRLENGHVVTAHCPNSGRMTTCSDPGRPVFLSFHDKPNRKFKYGWELIQMPASMVGVNTLVPNRLVQLAAQTGKIEEFAIYNKVRREVKSGAHTRFDLQLTADGHPPCFVEVKNCTLVHDKTAFFPDAVTTRGQSHLLELRRQVQNGMRCFMFFVIQRMDAKILKPADHIDPEYGAQLRRAVKAGVELIAYDVYLDLEGIRLRNRLPCTL